MATDDNPKRNSIFDEQGFASTIDAIKEEIRELYKADAVPWVIGYSGGKDSTAILQLTWLAISELEVEQRTKPIHVISTDTLVENPVVAAWVNGSLEAMQQASDDGDMPIQPHRLTPAVANTFWVNLIGRGYPAPRNKFRWCTERLKIMPSNTFIRNVVRENGEAILLLGTRRAESSRRAHNMKKHAEHAIRDRLTPNASLPNSLVYTPIEDWTNDDVWLFLMQQANCWGYSNEDLMGMYRGASADNECPLVVDTSTPSCGNSRFGCWVCTLVDEDKSMSAMIRNDSEKEWMLPMLELRNELDFRGEEARNRERKRRDFRRITGRLTYYTNKDDEGQLVPGPYKQETRAEWLRKVLETQKLVRDLGPESVGQLELISMEELQEIRRIWVVDKNEIEDLLPGIYQQVMGEAYPGPSIDDNLVFDTESLSILKEQAGDDSLHFEMVRNLLNTERRYRTMASRRGLFDAIEKQIKRCFYDDEQDALNRAAAIHAVKKGEYVNDRGERVDPDSMGGGDVEIVTTPVQLTFGEDDVDTGLPGVDGEGSAQ